MSQEFTLAVKHPKCPVSAQRLHESLNPAEIVDFIEFSPAPTQTISFEIVTQEVRAFFVAKGDVGVEE